MGASELYSRATRSQSVLLSTFLPVSLIFVPLPHRGPAKRDHSNVFATLRINERQNLVLDLNQRNRHSPSLAAANGFELQLVRVVVDQMGLGEVVIRASRCSRVATFRPKRSLHD